MNAKEQPLISVIVPVYKVEKYLPACLDSLLAQTYQNFELLLVDDGSPDKCWEILQQYAAQDARVCIFRKENGGVSSARNFGLEQARGEYICFVDSDDLVLPQYLEWLYDALCSCGTRIAMCRYRSIRENETLWTVSYTHLDVYKRQGYNSAHAESSSRVSAGLLCGSQRKNRVTAGSFAQFSYICGASCGSRRRSSRRSVSSSGVPVWRMIHPLPFLKSYP